MHPDDRPEMYQYWKESLAPGKQFDMKLRLRSASGEHRWFVFRTAPVYNTEGQFVQWIGTCNDCHDFTMTEERLRKASAELRSERKMFYTIIGNLPVGVIAAKSPSGEIFYTILHERQGNFIPCNE